jgi:hypothetical protein
LALDGPSDAKVNVSRPGQGAASFKNALDVR